MSRREKALFGSEWPISLWPRWAVTLSLLQHVLPPPPRPMTRAVHQKELAWKLMPRTVQYSEDTPVSSRSSRSALPWHPSWERQFPRWWIINLSFPPKRLFKSRGWGSPVISSRVILTSAYMWNISVKFQLVRVAHGWGGVEISVASSEGQVPWGGGGRRHCDAHSEDETDSSLWWWKHKNQHTSKEESK